MKYDSNQIALHLNSSCIENLGIMLEDDSYNGIIRHNVVPSNNVDLCLETLEAFNDCLLDVSFAYTLDLQEVHCAIEKTNEIFYDGILKPEPFHLDLINKLEHEYHYPQNINPNLSLWILDTGVNWRHKEFAPGQVIDVDPNFNINNITISHGTGTASISGGLNYGTSKNVPIYNYPVCRSGGGCGSTDVENGLRTALSFLKNNPGRRSVINLSIGSYFGSNPINSSLGKYYDGLFKEILNAGGIIVNSAGNSNVDACTFLYSYSPNVISVGSIDKNYNKSSFSNYGSCVDIWSFGSSVPLAYSVKDNNYISYASGTSFSGPIVAGLVVNMLNQNMSLSKQEILDLLYDKINNFTVPYYSCENMPKRCCRSEQGTRQDAYCKKLSLDQCIRSCTIKNC